MLKVVVVLYFLHYLALSLAMNYRDRVLRTLISINNMCDVIRVTSSDAF